MARRIDAGGIVRALLPGEDAGGEDAVEADLAQAAEERLEVDLALADVEMLMDADRSSRAG